MRLIDRICNALIRDPLVKEIHRCMNEEPKRFRRYSEHFFGPEQHEWNDLWFGRRGIYIEQHRSAVWINATNPYDRAVLKDFRVGRISAFFIIGSMERNWNLFPFFGEN